MINIAKKYRFQNWRVVAERKDGKQHLIILGNSYDQVKRDYIDVFCDLLTDDEQILVKNIKIEKWKGAEDFGKWIHQESIKIPNVVGKN